MVSGKGFWYHIFHGFKPVSLDKPISEVAYKLSNALAPNKEKSRMKHPLRAPGWTIVEGTLELKVISDEYDGELSYNLCSYHLFI